MSSSKNENKIKYLKSQFILEKEDTPKKNIILKKSKLSTNTLIRTIFKKFNLKYNIMPKRYNKIIMDNIIFNEKSHIVSPGPGGGRSRPRYRCPRPDRLRSPCADSLGRHRVHRRNRQVSLLAEALHALAKENFPQRLA